MLAKPLLALLSGAEVGRDPARVPPAADDADTEGFARLLQPDSDEAAPEQALLPLFAGQGTDAVDAAKGTRVSQPPVQAPDELGIDLAAPLPVAARIEAGPGPGTKPEPAVEGEAVQTPGAARATPITPATLPAAESLTAAAGPLAGAEPRPGQPNPGPAPAEPKLHPNQIVPPEASAARFAPPSAATPMPEVVPGALAAAEGALPQAGEKGAVPSLRPDTPPPRLPATRTEPGRLASANAEPATAGHIEATRTELPRPAASVPGLLDQLPAQVRGQMDTPAFALAATAAAPAVASPAALAATPGMAGAGLATATLETWTEQLMLQLPARFDSATEMSRIRIQLAPESLGSLDIDLRQTGDGVEVRVLTEHAATRGLLEEHQLQLRDRLAQQGLSLQSFDCQLSQQHRGRDSDTAASSESAAGQENDGKPSPEPRQDEGQQRLLDLYA